VQVSEACALGGAIIDNTCSNKETLKNLDIPDFAIALVTLGPMDNILEILVINNTCFESPLPLENCNLTGNFMPHR
jgi:hypothetical protein